MRVTIKPGRNLSRGENWMKSAPSTATSWIRLAFQRLSKRWLKKVNMIVVSLLGPRRWPAPRPNRAYSSNTVRKLERIVGVTGKDSIGRLIEKHARLEAPNIMLHNRLCRMN